MRLLSSILTLETGGGGEGFKPELDSSLLPKLEFELKINLTQILAYTPPTKKKPNFNISESEYAKRDLLNCYCR